MECSLVTLGPVPRSFLDEDATLTDDTTIRVVETIVLLIATSVTEIKRLLFVENIIDSIKVFHVIYSKQQPE